MLIASVHDAFSEKLLLNVLRARMGSYIYRMKVLNVAFFKYYCQAFHYMCTSVSVVLLIGGLIQC